MADLTITAAGVGSTGDIKKVQIGEIAAVGSVVYLDSSAGTWKLAEADNTAAIAGENGVGILLTEVEAALQYGVVATGGLIYLNGGVAEGTTYCVSANVGLIAPDADLGSGSYKTVLGIGGPAAGTSGFDEFLLEPIYSGHQIP